MRALALFIIVICVAGALLAAPGLASGCPVCDGETAQQVRAALADGDGLLVNLLAATLPSLAFAGVVAAVHLGWPAPREPRP